MDEARPRCKIAAIVDVDAVFDGPAGEGKCRFRCLQRVAMRYVVCRLWVVVEAEEKYLILIFV